ncbi:MAG: ABC transporter ATP-binding protein [Bdellovibrionales bacterium]|nr:ABC transporter ATP-binding protein [Bdellovibrionales bacterium]
MTRDAVFKVENLQVSYGPIQALKGLDFEVKRGEIVSLIGGNGAGKTTTLRALSGIVESQGRIFFCGTDISTMEAPSRVGLGISQSPEGRGIFPQMSVLENLSLGAYLRNNKVEIADDLEKCFALFPRIRERAKQVAGTLSGGEQQMLAICRCLMSRPKVLLLDEPSMGLAPLIVSQIFKIIVSLNQEGMTVLLVEQNARMALKIAHRAYVLETGRIVMTGTGAELLSNDSVRRAYLGI